jgi:hypothetical protein
MRDDTNRGDADLFIDPGLLLAIDGISLSMVWYKAAAPVPLSAWRQSKWRTRTRASWWS